MCQLSPILAGASTLEGKPHGSFVNQNLHGDDIYPHIYPHATCTLYIPTLPVYCVYTRDEVSHYFGAQISELCICSQSQNIVRLGSGLYLYDYRFIIIIITLGVVAVTAWCTVVV